MSANAVGRRNQIKQTYWMGAYWKVFPTLHKILTWGKFSGFLGTCKGLTSDSSFGFGLRVCYRTQQNSFKQCTPYQSLSVSHIKKYASDFSEIWPRHKRVHSEHLHLQQGGWDQFESSQSLCRVASFKHGHFVVSFADGKTRLLVCICRILAHVLTIQCAWIWQETLELLMERTIDLIFCLLNCLTEAQQKFTRLLKVVYLESHKQGRTFLAYIDDNLSLDDTK